jgi:glutamate dehydrogenase (NAD(P)+)
VEDNPADTRLIQENLVESRHPFKLTHVGRLSTALRRLAAGDIDVVLLDLSLPDSQKEDTFFRIQQASDVPIVVLTGLQDEELD